MSRRALLLIALLSGCSFVIDLPELPFCGDGLLSQKEECDDGNDIAGDGCNPGCVGPLEQVLSSSIEGGQSCPSIAFYSSGAWILSYDDESAMPPDTDPNGAVRARHFDSLDQPTGPDFVVHQNVEGEQEHSSVAAGEIAVVVWDESEHAPDIEVRGRAFSQNGAALGADFALTEIPAGDQSTPAVETSTAGFLTVWFDGTRQQVRGRKIDLGGTPIDAELSISEVGAVATEVPAIGGDGDRFLVVWPEASMDGQALDIRGRFVGWDGAMSATFTVNSTRPGVQNEPDLAFDPTSGRFLVVWSDASGIDDNDSTGVRGRLVARDGSFAGEDFLINDAVERAQENPAVAAKDGIFLVAWTGMDEDLGEDNTGVRARRVRSDGAFVDADRVINTITVGKQEDPTVAAGPRGFYLLWEDESGVDPDPSNDSVRGVVLSVTP